MAVRSETTKNLSNVFKGIQARFMQKINEILAVEFKIYANLYYLLYVYSYTCSISVPNGLIWYECFGATTVDQTTLNQRHLIEITRVRNHQVIETTFDLNDI